MSCLLDHCTTFYFCVELKKKEENWMQTSRRGDSRGGGGGGGGLRGLRLNLFSRSNLKMRPVTYVTSNRL